MPAIIAAVCPKLRRKVMILKRRSPCAISARIGPEPSVEPSSMKMTSKGRPITASSARSAAASGNRLPASSSTGMTIETSPSLVTSSPPLRERRSYRHSRALDQLTVNCGSRYTRTMWTLTTGLRAGAKALRTAPRTASSTTTSSRRDFLGIRPTAP